MTPLRIGLDARFIPGERGGVEQATLGLAYGLSQLADGDEEYYFLIYAGTEDWIRPYLRGACRTLPGPIAPRPVQSAMLRSLRSIARRVWHQVSPLLGARSVSLPRSDGVIERAQIDLMHFTNQLAFLTDIPSLFQPWDLQHIHLPQFFTPRERLAREVTFRTYCQRAACVIAPSQWGQRDLVAQYDLPADKIAVVPVGPAPSLTPPTVAACELARQRYALPERFIFYPAQTWAHKNHLRVLEALAWLRDQRQQVVPLVCSGTLNDFYPKIEKHLHELRLENQVQFLGYVSALDLRCLYQLSRAMVFPSEFEGFGLPLLEAFKADVPVACSNVTCLPEIAAGAALLFDPRQIDQLAEAIARVWTDESLRRTLIGRGQVRARNFSWERTARIFRAHYRRLACRPLTDEDRTLIVASTNTSVEAA